MSTPALFREYRSLITDYSGGRSITDTTRGWGQTVGGYGNNIKDSVGVGGARVATAGNPLGMAGMGSSQGGKVEKGVRNAGKGSASNPLGV